jgi:hypothetical protein
MQQRRGLHRDLPLPLKPGEIGLTTDTRELFIGNDTADALGGIHNKTVQVGNVNGGYNHVNSLLTDNIIEFTVKRSIISSQTGVGPFTVQKIHSGLSALASASIALETGINDQTLKIYKYSPANYSHKKLLPGDPDGAPIIIGDYNISGTNSLNLIEALVSNDIIYVVYLNKKDLETNLISAFNTNFNLSSGSLTDLSLKLSVDQLYFDESTGEGFIGLNNAQITNTSYTSAGGKTVKTWLQEWITSASNVINAAFVILGATYYSNNSLTGGKGIALFGDDTDGNSTAESAIPSYTFDSDLGFSTRSHEAAIHMTTFLNHSWLMEGSTPTRELSHLRSNIKIVTENNAGDLWSNIAIGNPLIRECKPTNVSGASGNQVRGTQIMRLLGSSSTTNQVNIGGVYYNTSGTRNLEMDYVIEWSDATPTYHVVRTGKATISMPMLADGTNVYGHALILDQWNEMDIMNTTGAISFAVGADFDLGVVVSPIVTIYGDPVITNEYAGTSALSDAAFNTKYGVTPSVALVSRNTTVEMDAAVTADTQVFWADDDSTSATYKQYFGFITYSNTRPVSGHIRFINKRF